MLYAVLIIVILFAGIAIKVVSKLIKIVLILLIVAIVSCTAVMHHNGTDVTTVPTTSGA